MTATITREDHIIITENAIKAIDEKIAELKRIRAREKARLERLRMVPDKRRTSYRMQRVWKRKAA